MEKDLKYLNQKWYYRLVKVAFVFFFISFIVGYNIFVFTTIEFKQISKTRTEIVCHRWSSNTFSPKDTGLTLYKNYFPNNIFDYKSFYDSSSNEFDIEAILIKCGASSSLASDVYTAQKAAEINAKYGDANGKTTYEDLPDIAKNDFSAIRKAVYNFEKIKYLDYSVKLFDIKVAYTYLPFLVWFFIGNIVIVLVFEGIRRIFYYIVLGTFLPKKDV